MRMVSVLIVDDDNFLHRVLERILTIGGHRVVGNAHNGSEAIEKFVELNPKPDVILMDHRMPVMNGTTATREIIQIDPDARVLFVSADDTVREEAIESGAVGFLTKPIRSSTLFSALKEYSKGTED